MRVLVLGLIGLALAAPAFAQQAPDRLPPIVLDLRGAFGKLGKSETTAANFAVSPEELPTRGIGVVGGLHVYLFPPVLFARGLGG